MQPAKGARMKDGAIHTLELGAHEAVPIHGRYGRLLLSICRGFALGGGAIFVSLVFMSLVSIIGRKLFSAPVPGDLEIMQMGSAVAGAAFLPYCEMAQKHLRVDFFTANMSPRRRAVLDAGAHFLLSAVAVIVAWRTAAEATSLYESGAASMMLSWQMWPATGSMVPSLVLLALAGLYNAFYYLGIVRDYPLSAGNGAAK